MTITLSPEQLAWIESRLASGDYADVDEALAEIERGEFTIVDDIDTSLRGIFHPEHG